MTTRNKYYLIFFIAIIAASLATGVFSHYHKQKQVLTLGVYTGSSWDVPNGKPYQMIDYAIKEFEKKHPNVEVKYETGVTKNDYLNWLSGKIVSGKMPDLVLVPDSAFSTLASEGAFMDLNPFLIRDDIKLSDYYPSLVKATQYYGKQVALPYEANPELLLYNKSLLAKKGLPTSWKQLTPDEFGYLCSKISSSKEHTFGTTADYDWYQAALSYGAQILSDGGNEVNLNTPKFLKALKLMQQIDNASQNTNVTNDMFDRGKVAFEPMTLAQYRTYTSYPYHVTRSFDFKVNCRQMPAEKGVSSTSIENTSWAISSASHHSVLAWEFLKLVCYNPKMQQQVMTYSSASAVLKQVVRSAATNKILHQYSSDQQTLTNKKLDQILASGHTHPRIRNYSQLYSRLDYMLTEALAHGDSDAELDEIQSTVSNLLK